MGSLLGDLPGSTSRSTWTTSTYGGGIRRWDGFTGPRCGGYDTRVTGPMKMALVVRRPTSRGSERHVRPTISPRQSCIQSRLATGSPLVWEPARSGKLGGFRWMAASWSTTPLWPPARRLTGWASRTRPKPWPNRSCARGNRSECWRTGRHGLRDPSSITLGTGRYQPVARLHQHDPRNPWFGLAQEFAEKPV